MGEAKFCQIKLNKQDGIINDDRFFQTSGSQKKNHEKGNTRVEKYKRKIRECTKIEIKTQKISAIRIARKRKKKFQEYAWIGNEKKDAI